MDEPRKEEAPDSEEGQEDPSARSDTGEAVDRAPEGLLRSPSRGSAYSPNETSLSREIAFRKVVNAIEAAGAEIDAVLDSDRETHPDAKGDLRSVAALASELLRHGLMWYLEEINKSPDKSLLKTNRDRHIAYEFARKTHAGFLDLVRRDRKENVVREEREVLMRRIVSRVEVYLNMGVDGKFKSRNVKSGHLLRERVEAEWKNPESP